MPYMTLSKWRNQRALSCNPRFTTSLSSLRESWLRYTRHFHCHCDLLVSLGIESLSRLVHFILLELLGLVDSSSSKRNDVRTEVDDAALLHMAIVTLTYSELFEVQDGR